MSVLLYIRNMLLYLFITRATCIAYHVTELIQTFRPWSRVLHEDTTLICPSKGLGTLLTIKFMAWHSQEYQEISECSRKLTSRSEQVQSGHDQASVVTQRANALRIELVLFFSPATVYRSHSDLGTKSAAGQKKYQTMSHNQK